MMQQPSRILLVEVWWQLARSMHPA